VLILGILAGSASMAHGFFEIMQGNKPTGDILARIGAYTILPSYLITGIACVVISVLTLIWTIGFIHKNHGASIYLLLIVLLFFVGGGVAPILGLLITWAVSTRITALLTWWSKALPEKSRKQLAKSWLVILITGLFFLLIGIGIWLFLTPPGETYQITLVDYICWSFLGLGFIFQILAIISGFARDLERRPKISQVLKRE
jgi:hypothetical protein